MKNVVRTAIIALSAAFISGASHAQSLEFGRDGVRVNPGFQQDNDIDRRDAVRAARRAGVDEADRVTRTGRDWVVEGADRRDRHIRVTVDGRDGDVIRVR